MLFRKVGAEKEEGRPKEDSLSETLRVLETTTGLGEPNMKCPKSKIKTNKHVTQKKELLVRAQKNTEEHMGDENSDRKLVMLLFKG